MIYSKTSIELLGQFGRDIILKKTERGWLCDVKGLCWLKGDFETSFPAFGSTPEEAADALINLVAYPKDGCVAHLRDLSTGTYQPVMVILIDRETK